MLIKRVLIFRLFHVHLHPSLTNFSTIATMNATVKPLIHSTKLAEMFIKA